MKNTGFRGYFLCAISFLCLCSCGLLRVSPGTSIIQSSVPAPRHADTVWVVEPGYAYDALCFINLLSGDEYYLEVFKGMDEADYARRVRDSLSGAERRSVRRLFFFLHDVAGTIPSSVLTALYATSGSRDLAEFRESLRDPASFRARNGASLDAFYRASLGGWRIPGPALDVLLRDVGRYIDLLDRVGFRDYWDAEIRPELAALASSLSGELASYNAVPEIESLIGYGLPENRIRAYLARFARPNGLSLGGTSFVMEERTNAPRFVGVTVHEILHRRVDWANDEALSRFLASIGKDSRIKAAFARRDRNFGYNTLDALAEEDLTKALDQIASESLGVAEDWRERWFFHDGGMHTLSPGFYLALKDAGYPASRPEGETLHSSLAAMVSRGAFAPGYFSACRDAAYGADRPGAMAKTATITAAYAAGDPALDAINPTYNEAMSPGMVVVFLDEWLVAGTPEESLRVLAAWYASGPRMELVPPLAARPPAGAGSDARTDGAVSADTAIPLSFAYCGNWSASRDGAQFFYRNCLYFRVPEASAYVPRPGDRFSVRFAGE